MTAPARRRCWCRRPVASDYPDAIECANHDDRPDRDREQLLDAIQAALTVRDMTTVADLVRRLAVRWPEDAQAILDALHLAQALAR